MFLLLVLKFGRIYNQSMNQSEIFSVAKAAIAIWKSTITWLEMSDDDVRE